MNMEQPKQIILEKTVYTQSQLELYSLPQIVFAGRSNVGKSSMINCLAGRKKLAKISATPGKTRSLNFYQVLPQNFYLVDLPGYGYARCSKKERDAWAKLIDAYLCQNNQIKLVISLLDSRLSPQALDLELISYMQSKNFKILGVLTKADKCKQNHKVKIKKVWQEILGSDVMFFSSKTGFGISFFWDYVFSSLIF